MSSEPTTTEATFAPHWARRASGDEVLPFRGAGPVALSMAYGLPDPRLFPAQELSEAAARVLADPARMPRALQYGGNPGVAPLLALLVEKLNADEGLGLAAENVLVTNGSSGAIGLAARALVDEGDTVLVEAPSFMGAMSILRRTGAKLHPVPAGSDGIDVAALEGVLESLGTQGIRPRVLYSMPTFHNPTGLTLSEAHRGALLAVARHYGLMIIEDDAYRDLYYESSTGALPPSLYALDEDGRVIRTGTFSKIIAPGLRLGWAIARPETIGKLMLLKEEGGTAPFVQHVAVEFTSDGALVAHIAALVEAYRAKRDAMLTALDIYFPGTVTWTRPAGGFFVWVTLPPALDASRLPTLAREEGVDYLRGERCFSDPESGSNHLRLSFSSLTLDEIEEAVKRLGKVLKTMV